MSDPEVHIYTFENGLTLLVEPRPQTRAAAFAFFVPFGGAHDPEGAEGAAALLADWVFRGAGPRDAQALEEALDSLGIQRSTQVGRDGTVFGGALLADDLEAALAIYADVLRRPHLPPEELEPVRSLALQALRGLEDQPAQKTFVLLQELFFPGPYGRNPMGTPEGLRALTPDRLREIWEAGYTPRGTVLAVAGRVDPEGLRDAVAGLFGDWEGPEPRRVEPRPLDEPRYRHVSQETAQEQIGVAAPALPVDHPDWYKARLGVGVLSGGMAARLFTEVREKRGLVYAVAARLRHAPKVGYLLAYAGTTPPRAQETLDVLLGELVRLSEGVTAAELERARAGLLSALVLQGESTPARAQAILGDWRLLGRVRSLEEIRRHVQAVTLEELNAFLADHPFGPFTVVTLGPTEVAVPVREG